MYDASNRKHIRAAEKSAKVADRTRGEVLARLASDVGGRHYLWDRLAELHVFTSTYNDNPSRMAFLEGQRAAGLSLLADILHWCPEQFLQMMVEANGRRSDDDNDTDRTAGDGPEPSGRGGDDQGHADSDDGGVEGAISDIDLLYRTPIRDEAGGED